MKLPQQDQEIICLESKAFYQLVEEVIQRLSPLKSLEKEKWINAELAMSVLGISSTTTLQKLRDDGKIRFTQPSRKVILYDRESIDDYLEAHAKDTF